MRMSAFFPRGSSRIPGLLSQSAAGETATITINARDARDAIYAATGGP